METPGPLASSWRERYSTISTSSPAPLIAGPARLVPLPALATEGLSANALRVAAVRGRLKAAKASDGTWRSSTAWVEEYVANRYKRPPS